MSALATKSESRPRLQKKMTKLNPDLVIMKKIRHCGFGVGVGGGMGTAAWTVHCYSLSTRCHFSINLHNKVFHIR